MEIQITSEIANTAPNPISIRQPDKVVLSLAKSRTDPGQDGAMNPGAGMSQAGLIAEALVSGSAAEDGIATSPPERVLKPWGIAMLPDELREEAHHDDAPTADDTAAPIERATPPVSDSR
jgi:hypothetical protein